MSRWPRGCFLVSDVVLATIFWRQIAILSFKLLTLTKRSLQVLLGYVVIPSERVLLTFYLKSRQCSERCRSARAR